LAGRVPYPRDNEIATAMAHLSESPPSLSELRPELAARFDPVIHMALAKEPSDRYAKASELADAVVTAAQESAVSPTLRSSDLAETKPEPTSRAGTAPPGWYPEPGTGRMRRWTGSSWAEFAPDGARDGVLSPAGWYLEPGSGRTRWWTGNEWSAYRSDSDGAGHKQEGLRGSQRPWRWAALVCAIVVVVLAVVGAIENQSGNSSTQSTSSSSQSPATPARRTVSLGRQLTAEQLAPVLVPQSAYQKLPDVVSGGIFQRDTSDYALQGGLPSLKLCSAAIRAPGLGADSAMSYEDVTVLPGNVYYGSDAASFVGRGAEQLLATAAAQAPTCGWRSLPGDRLDDQVVRLTTDQAGPENTSLHDDVILVRSGAAVLEIGTAVFSGSHSNDAEILAEGAARRLAQAERGQTG
jgi:hypothetical protein